MASDYQLDFNGTIMGDGTTYDIVSWAGLEEFVTRNTDVMIPAGWGAISGASYVQPRVVTITVETVDPAAIAVLETVLVPPALSAPSTLGTIRWKFPNREELTARARCSRRGRPRNLTTALGLTSLTFELEVPDPRQYAYVPTTAVGTVFVAGGGGWELDQAATTNLGWDLTVGAGADLGWELVGSAGSGLVALVNSGDVETYPVFTFSAGTGLSQWSVTNQTTGVVASFLTPLASGQTLVADMAAAATSSGTVTPITVGGASRYAGWVAPRTPMALPPGTSLLRFDVQSGDPLATVAISAPSAYL